MKLFKFNDIGFTIWYEWVGKRGAYMPWFSGIHLKEADIVGDIILTE